MRRSEIKEISKRQLNRNGNWKIPVLLTAVTLLISGYSTSNQYISQSLILTISITLVNSLLNVYFVKSCLEIAKSYEDEYIGWANIMINGKTFIKCILYSILMSLLTTVITLSITLLGWTIPVMFIAFGFLAIIIGIVISIYSAFSIFIIIDMDVDIFEALRISINLIRGHFGEMIVLILSFIWWYLLGIVTLGIAMFWVIPYMTITFCNYYLHFYRNKYN